MQSGAASERMRRFAPAAVAVLEKAGLLLGLLALLGLLILLSALDVGGEYLTRVGVHFYFVLLAACAIDVEGVHHDAPLFALFLLLVAGSARADVVPPANNAIPAEASPTNNTLQVEATPPPLVSPGELKTFCAVTGALVLNDHAIWHLFDTDITEPSAKRDRLPDDISLLGDGRTLILASTIPMLVDGQHGRQAGTKALKALAAASLASTGIKCLVGKERPAQSGGAIRYRGPRLSNSSFPSGHATCAFAVATVMAQEYPRYRYLFWGLATAVGAARIYSAAHFPSDVWAGAGLGIYMGRRASRGNTNLLSWSF
ncbi:MAG TPA: phosphatase PAP2 family protein [Armatimonadota bacterium]|nr:phosphatase PAP2 family protein [Armatimonadota bacterium]